MLFWAFHSAQVGDTSCYLVFSLQLLFSFVDKRIMCERIFCHSWTVVCHIFWQNLVWYWYTSRCWCSWWLITSFGYQISSSGVSSSSIHLIYELCRVCFMRSYFTLWALCLLYVKIVLLAVNHIESLISSSASNTVWSIRSVYMFHWLWHKSGS